MFTINYDYQSTKKVAKNICKILALSKNSPILERIKYENDEGKNSVELTIKVFNKEDIAAIMSALNEIIIEEE